MNKERLAILFITSFLIFSQVLFGQQPVVKSKYKVTFLGRTYYSHVVQKGQTLSGISAAYNVSEKEISLANPEVFTGLKIGQTLKIPVLEQENTENIIDNHRIFHTVKKRQTLFYITNLYQVDEKEIIRLNPDLKKGLKAGMILTIPNKKEEAQVIAENYIYHKVKSKETLFSLANRYGVQMREIIALNPSVKKGLKVDQVLKIPKGNYVVDEKLEVNTENTDENQPKKQEPCVDYAYKKKEIFEVALMLPLYINDNYSRSTSFDELGFFNKSERFMEMYEGALLAVDVMRKKGLSVNLRVYDTEKNPNKVRSILLRPEMKDVDLIIGPVYSENVKIAGEFAHRNKISIVSPLSQNKSLINGNPYLFQVIPSENARVEQTANHLAKHYDKSIIVIHNGTAAEQKMIETYRRKLVSTDAFRSSINEIVFKQINYKSSKVSDIEDALSVGLDNIVIIPSSDEVFVSVIVEKLAFLANKYKITIYGLSEWEFFRNSDLNYMNKLNLHFPSSSFVEYQGKKANDLVIRYRTYYKSEPSQYAFQAYDIMYYFLNVLMRYGKDFHNCISDNPKLKDIDGARLKFNFKKKNNWSGYENQGVFILQLQEDMMLKSVN